MLDAVVRFDTWIFLALNAGMANAFFDWLMPIVTEVRHWLPFIGAGMVALAVFGGGKGRSAVLLAIVLLAATDQLSSHLIKPWIGRIRPCHVVEGARAIYRCGDTFAFPSGHATNSMAAAVFFGILYRRWLCPLLALTLLISYSRVYLGVHYPLDILGGWTLGGGAACGIIWLYRRYLQHFLGRFRLLRAAEGEAARAAENPTESD